MAQLSTSNRVIILAGTSALAAAIIPVALLGFFSSRDRGTAPEARALGPEGSGRSLPLLGRVRDSRGRAVSDARVRLLWLAGPGGLFFGAPSDPPVLREVETQTDGEGRFGLGDLLPGAVSLRVDAEGELPYAVDLTLPAPGPVEIVLPGQATIFGTVRVATGEALSQATITAGVGSKSYSTQTAPDGAYRLQVPAGSLLGIRASVPNREPRSRPEEWSTWFGEHTAIRLEAGSEREENFVFPAGSSIGGVVLEPDGAVATEAQAVLNPLPGTEGPKREQETRDDGRFLFEGLPPGAYLIAASSERGTTVVPLALEPGPEARRAQESATLVLPAAGCHRETCVQLAAFAEARGCVLDARERPVARACVSADGTSAPVRTNESGEFRIRVPPHRRYQLYAHPANTTGYSLSSLHLPALSPGEIREGLQLRFCQPARIRIRVTDGNGVPIAGALVRGTVGHDPFGLNRHTNYGDLTQNRTGPDGWLESPGWPEITYHLQVEALGYARQTVEFECHAGSEVVKHIRLARPAAGTLAGVVLSADGEPISGATITAWARTEDSLFSSEREEYHGALSDAQGNFWITGLDAETYVLYARAPGHIASDPLEVALGRDDIRIVLDRGISIEGYVTFESGDPARFVKVSAGDVSILTDNRGYFLLEGIKPDAGQIKVTGESIYPAAFEIASLAEETTLAVQERPAFRGLVLDPEGEPLPNARLAATYTVPPDEAHWLSLATDYQGRYRVRWDGEAPPRPGSTLRVKAPYFLAAEDCLPIVVEAFTFLPAGTVLRFERGRRARVRVLDSAGKPLKRVVLGYRLFEDHHRWTDGEGRVTLGPFPPGMSAVEICDPYTTREGKRVLVDPGLPENVIRVERMER
jgi:protocatechuate 3,4-dioxygenase beta subunit